MKDYERLALQDSVLGVLSSVRLLVAAFAHADGHGVRCECTVCDSLTDALKSMETADREAIGLDDDDD